MSTQLTLHALYVHDQGAGLSLRELRTIGQRNQSQSERIREWFLRNDRPVASHELATILGMRRENGVACRLSELFRDGFLEKAHKTPGPLGVDVWRYQRRAA